MSEKSSANGVIEFIEAFLNGDIERRDFVKGFSRRLAEHLAAMRLEDPQFAEAMSFYMKETGIDIGGHFSDGAFEGLIRKRYCDLLGARASGDYQK